MALSFWEDIAYTFWPSEEQKKFKEFMAIASNYFYKEENLKKFNLPSNIALVKKWSQKVYGMTPMHQAAHYGNTRLMRLFLDSQEEFACKSSDIDEKGWSVLHHATHSTLSNYLGGRSAGWWTIELLVADGVDTDYRNNEGKLAKDFFAGCDRYLLESYSFAESRGIYRKHNNEQSLQIDYLESEKKRLNMQLEQTSNPSSSPESDHEILPVKICDLIKKMHLSEDNKDLSCFISKCDMDALQLILNDEKKFNNQLNETYNENFANKNLNEQCKLSSLI